jgi:hypothetical protein
MIADKKEFSKGAFLMVVFLVVLVLMFMPLFNGKNALEYSDDLYNSISKQSAYYIPDTRDKVTAVEPQPVTMELAVGEDRAEQAAKLFQAAGARVDTAGGTLTVQGDLKEIQLNALEDAEALFRNNAKALEEKYGYGAQAVLYNWWVASNAMDKNLSKQKLFKAAKLVDTVKKKAVEPAYNYFGIEPQKLSEQLGIVIFSLVFYVVYTLWYGFGILYLLEGWGMRLEH